MLSLVCAAVLGVSGQIPRSFRVISFNVRYGTANDGENSWPNRREGLLKALREQGPGIIAVQEALAEQVKAIEEFGDTFESVGVGRDDGRDKGEYSAILYTAWRFKVLRSDTFWLSDTPTVPNSMHWGNKITRICTWAHFYDKFRGKYFYVFNTHLDHQSQESREKSAALILRRISERSTPDPVLITGDFNVGESNPVVAAIKAKGFVDTYRIVWPNEKAVGTFNGWNAEVGADKIDYVFADANWTVRGASIMRDKVNGRWISDHLPVVGTVEQK